MGTDGYRFRTEMVSLIHKSQSRCVYFGWEGPIAFKDDAANTQRLYRINSSSDKTLRRKQIATRKCTVKFVLIQRNELTMITLTTLSSFAFNIWKDKEVNVKFDKKAKLPTSQNRVIVIAHSWK